MLKNKKWKCLIGSLYCLKQRCSVKNRILKQDSGEPVVV